MDQSVIIPIDTVLFFEPPAVALNDINSVIHTCAWADAAIPVPAQCVANVP